MSRSALAVTRSAPLTNSPDSYWLARVPDRALVAVPCQGPFPRSGRLGKVYHCLQLAVCRLG
jgi:hypothetical protein